MALRNTQAEQDAREAQYQASRTAEDTAREWRDKELRATDYIVSLMDFTPHQDWLDYRQQLRDLPTSDGFPEVFPSRPNQPTPKGY